MGIFGNCRLDIYLITLISQLLISNLCSSPKPFVKNIEGINRQDTENAKIITGLTQGLRS